MTYKNTILHCRKYLKVSRNKICQALDISERDLQRYEQLGRKI